MQQQQQQKALQGQSGQPNDDSRRRVIRLPSGSSFLLFVWLVAWRAHDSSSSFCNAFANIDPLGRLAGPQSTTTVTLPRTILQNTPADPASIAKTTTSPANAPAAAQTAVPPPSYRDRAVEASQRLGVRLGKTYFFPPWFWKLSWRVHGRCLPWLHFWDAARTPDLDNCLKCLWCKALSGLDATSPAYDAGLAYDMLPSVTRWLVLRLLPLRIFPRLVHYVIELRTTFLNRALKEEMQRVRRSSLDGTFLHPTRRRLISLGAGYDTRSVLFLNTEEEEFRLDEAFEIDMPQVVESKSIMLQRLLLRRPGTKLPTLLAQDLTDVDRLQTRLDEIFHSNPSQDQESPTFTFFLVEGVLIYLKEANRSNVLSTCANYLKKSNLEGALLFADRIRKPSDPQLAEIQNWMRADGWDLVEGSFTVHPGKARHMGMARVLRS